MYDFVDKGERHISLRPEMTASVCRSFAQHRPTTPWKVFYAGSNFRYEKPQRGRYRQFDQVGIEILGVDDAQLDVEVIALAWEFYRRLGLRQVDLIVNCLGEPAERASYVEALRTYFLDAGDALTEQSRATLERNPLRVLDSKREPDQAVIAGAPTIADHRERSRRHTSKRWWTAWARSTSRSPSNRNWSAASTTTGARSSSSRAARSTRHRTRSAAAAATTASSRRSAVRPLPASASPSASTARCSPATTRACSPPTSAASTPSSSTWSAASKPLRLTAEIRAAGLAADRGYDHRR